MLKKAIIAGASGLIGNELLRLLLQSSDYEEVLILVRKELPVNHARIVQLVINFDELAKWAPVITGHTLFCCLGTTMAKTPDKSIYRKIDHDYPVQLAQIAKQNKIKQYHFVSALGADISSSSFYTKLKGETEEDIEKVGLDILHIYRPSLLTGDRQEKRIIERIATVVMKVINPLLIGNLKKYRSIPAATVASAMFKESLKNEVGTYIHPSDKIKQLA